MLTYVPGEVWARLVGRGEGATHLLATYLALEVAALPRPLYAKVGLGRYAPGAQGVAKSPNFI